MATKSLQPLLFADQSAPGLFDRLPEPEPGPEPGPEPEPEPDTEFQSSEASRNEVAQQAQPCLPQPEPAPAPTRTLRLTRPLCSFDLETTGLDPDRDRIVEIAMVWLHPDGSRTSWTDKVNPQMPIPPASTAIHGISDADVRDAKTFAQLAPKVLAMLKGCDLTGFNMEKFDIPFLAAEFRRCAMVFPEPGTAIVDAFVLFQRKEPRDLTAALRLYCGQERKDAHQALADAEGAADILLGQLRHYPDLPLDPQGLHDWLHPRDPNWHDPEGKLTWDGDDLLCNFGKHKGKPLLDMARTDADYLRWLLNKDFSLAVKDAVSLALRGHQPPKPTA